MAVLTEISACNARVADGPLVQMIRNLLDRLGEPWVAESAVIPWSCPVPSFGDLTVATVATLGLNPSNREFVDEAGQELSEAERRLPTLRSLGLRSWADAGCEEIKTIIESGRAYFTSNPYDGWFRALDKVLSGTRSSYYCSRSHACHLDLIPFATMRKWTELRPAERRHLLDVVGDTLGLALRASRVGTLVLNGASVAGYLEKLSGVRLNRVEMPSWLLPRRSGSGVSGFAYHGFIDRCGDVELGRRVSVIGFNHNLQSSFGVTTSVKAAIREWVQSAATGEVECLHGKINSSTSLPPLWSFIENQPPCRA